METRRVSAREKRQPQNYFKEESSDDEGDDEKTKAAKQKLKQMMNDDSEVESDFEKEIDNQVEEMSESDESEEEESKKLTCIKGTVGDNNVKSFRLSESESSDDEEEKGKKKIKNDSGNIFLRRESHSLEDVGEDESSQMLLAIAGGLSQAHEVWKETTRTPPAKEKKKGKGKASNKRKSIETFETVKKPKKENEVASMDSISKLLAQGEGVQPHENLTSDEEPLREPVVAMDGVEITVPVPEHLRKKKKKGFDVEAYLKREMAREVRELSLVTHKSGLVCLLAHVLHLNSVTSDPGLQCLALSLVPQNNLFTKVRNSPHVETITNCFVFQDTITLIRLGHLVSWLRDSIPISKHSEQVSIKPVAIRLEQALASLLVLEDMELVLVFALVCRALGLNTRLVVNLNLPSKCDSNKPASNKDTKSGRKDKKKTKTETSASGSRKRSKSSDSESEEDEKKKVDSKSKRKSKSSTGGDKKSEEKPSLASKLAAAVSKRKSKTLAPTVTEDTIIEGIKESPSKEAKRSRSTRSKSSKSCREVEQEKQSTSKASCSNSRKNEKTSEHTKEKNIKSKSQTVMDPDKSNNMYKQNYWVEVFLHKEKKWIPVDVLSGKVNNPSDIESRLAKPVMYVLAVNMKGLVKDVTRRYSSNYLTQSRKLRVDETWFDKTLCPWLDRDNKKEDTELVKKSEEGPLPTSVSAFKGHPLYALQRHLLKFEAIYPVEAPTLGFIRGEPVYARECVHTLLGRTAWLKEGKVVRIGEEPYKVVKARPKWDRMSGTKKADEPLELVHSILQISNC